jgi:hypothetical protein
MGAIIVTKGFEPSADLLKPGTTLEVFDGRRESMSGSCCVVW